MRDRVNLLALCLRQKRFNCSGHIHTQHTHHTHMHTYAPHVTKAHARHTRITRPPPTGNTRTHHTGHTPSLHPPTIPLPDTQPHRQFLPLFLSFMAGPSLYANLTDPNTLCRNFCSEDQCLQIPALKQYLWTCHQISYCHELVSLWISLHICGLFLPRYLVAFPVFSRSQYYQPF